MKKQIVVGIDPGITGCIAVVDENLDCDVTFIDMPTRIDGKTPKGNPAKRVDEYALVAVIRHLYSKDCVFFLERQQGGTLHGIGRGHKQSPTSAFRTGYGFGVMIGALEALDARYGLVNAGQWKKELELVRTEKRDSLELARALFPSAASQLKRVMDHNRAEALLVAQYGRLRYKGATNAQKR